jgi:hypothetical protein
MHNNPAKDTTALAKIHFDTIFMFVLLAKRKGPRGPENTDLVTMGKKLRREDGDNRKHSALPQPACQVENQ